LEHTRQALRWLARESADLPAIVVGEYYEKRWFVSGTGAIDFVESFPFTTRQLFRIGELIFAIEICEDLWAPVPPSRHHALAGAAVVLNLSASNDWVTKADYRRELVRQQSARLNAGYVYVSSGPTESSKDLVYGGHAMIAENGELLAESERLRLDGSMIAADLDVDMLLHERSRNMTFGGSPGETYQLTDLGVPLPLESLQRRIEPLPFVPSDPPHVSDRAREILHLQGTGLARRLGSARPVLGVSGGLDSTLALLDCGETMKRLGRAPDQVQSGEDPCSVEACVPRSPGGRDQTLDEGLLPALLHAAVQTHDAACRPEGRIRDTFASRGFSYARRSLAAAVAGGDRCPLKSSNPRAVYREAGWEVS
jgi:hypothetical protein